MIRKCLHVICSISFILSFILMVLCLVIVVSDTLSALKTGEFKLLPVFNIVEWVNNIDELPDGEKVKEWNRIGDYFLNYLSKDQYLDMWHFINRSTTYAFVNLLVYHALFYFKINFRKSLSVMVWTACFISLILIIFARIYVSSGDYEYTIADVFPIAYSIFRRSFNLILSIIFIAFTHFVKHAEHTRKAIHLYFRTRANDE